MTRDQLSSAMHGRLVVLQDQLNTLHKAPVSAYNEACLTVVNLEHSRLAIAIEVIDSFQLTGEPA